MKTVRNIQLSLVNEKVLTKYLLEQTDVKVKKGSKLELKVELYADWIGEKVDDTSDDFGACDHCKAPVAPGLSSCPVCGTGDGAPTLLLDLDAPVTRTVETTGVTVVDTADLDASVMRIKELTGSMSTSYWRLGRELKENFDRKLYKTRVDGSQKPKYKSWNEFSEAELCLSGNQTRTVMAIAERFTEEQVSRFGVEKLKFVAKAPKAQQPQLLVEAEKLSSRSLAAKVRGGHRKEPSGGRAAALAAGTAAAKQAREKRAQQVQEGGVTCVFQMGEVELPLRQSGEGRYITTENLINGVVMEYEISTKGRRRMLRIKRIRAQVTPEAAQ